MAGHRLPKGQPTRTQARTDRSATRLNTRLALATTPEQRAAASWDALRSACARFPDRGARALEEASRLLAGLTREVTERGERQ